MVENFIKINNLNIKIGWGEKKYRKIEVFDPWNNFVNLPGYNPIYDLDNGLKDLIIT